MELKDKIENAKLEINEFSNKHAIYNLDNFEIQVASALMVHRDFHVSRAWQLVWEKDFYVLNFPSFKDFESANEYTLEETDYTQYGVAKFIKSFVFTEHKFCIESLSKKEFDKWKNFKKYYYTDDNILSNYNYGDVNVYIPALIVLTDDIKYWCKKYDIPMTDEEIHKYW